MKKLTELDVKLQQSGPRPIILQAFEIFDLIDKRLIRVAARVKSCVAAEVELMLEKR